MTKYCPQCESEFQDSIEVCPDDGDQLFKTKVVNIKRKEMIDIYVASSEIEAELIVSTLSDKGITARIFRPQISMFPTLSDRSFVIATRLDEKEKAMELLNQARSDNILSTKGIFI